MSITATIKDQLVHIGWGGFLALAFPLFFSAGSALLIAVSIPFIKESLESIWGIWEPKQPWLNGTIDFSFFCIGIIVAEILLCVA